MPVFKTSDFTLLHVDKAKFHFLFEVGFNVSKSVLKGLIVFKAQALFLYGQATFVFLMQLGFYRSLHLALSVFKLLALLNIMVVAKGINFPLETEI